MDFWRGPKGPLKRSIILGGSRFLAKWGGSARRRRKILEILISERLKFLKENAFPNAKRTPKYPKFSACGGLFPTTVVVWICFSYCPRDQFYHHYWECARAACETFSRAVEASSPTRKTIKTSLLASQNVLPNDRSAFLYS